jgi:hypothetical protein
MILGGWKLEVEYQHMYRERVSHLANISYWPRRCNNGALLIGCIGEEKGQEIRES